MTSDAQRATAVCSRSSASLWMYSLHTLRVKRFAAAIDMTAAGTKAPIAIAANANPSNHDGKYWMNRSGTAKFLSVGLIPAAIAISPVSASRPSMSEYTGRIAMLRRTTSCDFALSVPVTACG